MDVHFSSKTDMWATPQDTFDALAAWGECVCKAVDKHNGEGDVKR
jgi:hypothetical protein